MRLFENLICLKKRKQPLNTIEIPKQYIVFLRPDMGYGLASELVTKEELEELVLKDRERIKYIFEYKDIIKIYNEIVEIKNTEE